MIQIPILGITGSNNPKINLFSHLMFSLSTSTKNSRTLPSAHRLIIEGSGKTWKQDQRVRLQHIDTSGYLHSHDKKYQRIAGGQQEVTKYHSFSHLSLIFKDYSNVLKLML